MDDDDAAWRHLELASMLPHARTYLCTARRSHARMRPWSPDRRSVVAADGHSLRAGPDQTQPSSHRDGDDDGRINGSRHCVSHGVPRANQSLGQQTPSFGPDQGLLVACAFSFFLMTGLANHRALLVADCFVDRTVKRLRAPRGAPRAGRAGTIATQAARPFQLDGSNPAEPRRGRPAPDPPPPPPHRRWHARPAVVGGLSFSSGSGFFDGSAAWPMDDCAFETRRAGNKNRKAARRGGLRPGRALFTWPS